MTHDLMRLKEIFPFVKFQLANAAPPALETDRLIDSFARMDLGSKPPAPQSGKVSRPRRTGPEREVVGFDVVSAVSSIAKNLIDDVNAEAVAHLTNGAEETKVKAFLVQQLTMQLLSANAVEDMLIPETLSDDLFCSLYAEGFKDGLLRAYSDVKALQRGQKLEANTVNVAAPGAGLQ